MILKGLTCSWEPITICDRFNTKSRYWASFVRFFDARGGIQLALFYLPVDSLIDEQP